MTLPVLVLNSGSSSLKAAVIDAGGRRLLDLVLSDLDGAPRLRIGAAERPLTPAESADPLAAVLTVLVAEPALAAGLTAIGHRVAHGGERFDAPVRVDAAVEAAIESLAPLSPLHNPAALAGIRAARQRWPGVAQVAVFDTAFHATLPRRARAYALPRDLSRRLGLRRTASTARATRSWRRSRRDG